MHPTFRAALAAAPLLTLFAAPAFAADPAPLDSVIVTARRDPEDPAVVSDARDRLSRTPGAVSVISQESFARREAMALDDMLRDAPGVFAQRKWGGDVRLSIRGSGVGNANHNRGLLLAEDGVPLNEADGSGDSQAADPLLTRYVEVYRGGNALRFGGAQLGGAINLATLDARTAGFSERVRLDGGAFGTVRNHLALARVAEDWDGLIAATNQRAQGWRSQSQQNIQFASLNLGRRLGEDKEVRLIVNGSNINQEIPGALTLGQIAADPRQPAPGNYASDQGRNQRGLRASLRTRWGLSDNTLFEGAVYGTWKDLDHPIFQVIDQESRNWGAFGRLAWDGELGGRKADGLAGLWLRTGDLDSHFYINRKGARGPLQSVSYQNAAAQDLFAEGRLFLSDRVALVGGASLGRTARDYAAVAVPGVASTFNLKAKKTYGWLSPRLGLLWEDESGAQLFANLTRSVEAPTFAALSPTNTGLAPVKPQAAWTAEAGLRGKRGPFAVDVTIYRARLDKELLQYSLSASIPATTFNADKTIHQGLEAAVDWQPVRALRLRQSFTWSDFRFAGDPVYGDNRLPVVPERFYRAEVRYQHPAGGFIAPSLEWAASRTFVDFQNTASAPAYRILNLNAGWDFKGLTVFLDARNLTGKRYVSNVQPVIAAGPGVAAYWPGDGRSVFAGLSADF